MRLSELPVHKSPLGVDQENIPNLRSLVRANLDTVNEKDAEGDTALNTILFNKNEVTVNSETVVLLLEAALPFDVYTSEQSPVDLDKPG